MIYRETLTNYARQGQEITIAVVGAGQMGEGLVCQLEQMQGMKVAVVVDIRPNLALQAFMSAGVAQAEVVDTNEPDRAAEAWTQGKRVATTHSGLLNKARIDIVVEATGIPEVGAQVARDAILNSQHVLQMNVETDATVGYILHTMAQEKGVIYTLTCGDEPGATAELYDFATTLGLEVVCAGKGKNNPLDRSANPDTVKERATQQQMNPKMLASFVDGTKTMVEMTSLANGIGFIPDIRGMHGPQAHPKNIAEVFCPATAGGVISDSGRVEYGIGIAPGVFVVFTATNEKIVRDLKYVNLGKGPYWALYRPYHLCNLETPISIIKAVLMRSATLATTSVPTTESVAVAKKNLTAGDTIDGLGGYSVYGMIEVAEAARKDELLPLGLAPSARLVKDVAQGEALKYSDVELNEESVIVQLRRRQDALIAG